MIRNWLAGLLIGPTLLVPWIGSSAWAQEADACLECHGDQSFREDEETQRLFVDLDVYSSSVHGDFSCVDCHSDADPEGHDAELAPVDCSMCHDDVVAEYGQSLHAYARERGNLKAPGCAGCHGVHDIHASADVDSVSNRTHVVEMCAKCHGEAGLLTDDLVRLPLSVQGYARSVHGHAFRRGIETAAICTDCHGVHGLKGNLDPTSRIHPVNVSATCGQCHGDIQAQYDRSIHGRALRAGIGDSPTCNSCHGEHQIQTPNGDNGTSHLDLAVESCKNCHQDSKITAKYGLADYVVDTYVDSYHGWATEWDSPDAATCVRCHTAHWVLPSRDPASTVHPSNLVETCQQCHPEADLKFSTSYTHKTASPSSNPITKWLELAYLILIPAVIGGMILHNALIIVFYSRMRRRREKEEGTVQRMDRNQLIQHLILAVSFTILVITGFALRFPDAFWVRPLAYLGMNEEMRSTIHRVAAVGMIIFGIWHSLYAALSPRGRDKLVALLPRWRDVSDFLGTLRYYLGLSRRRVKFDQFDYTQKVEYWALVWGTVIMAFTGIVLWFPAATVKYFPVWIIQASELVHYYEAWLAALAIVFWHFFFVLLHPEVYPMSWTWLTGEMSKHEAEAHHGDWYAKIAEGEEKA